MSSDLVLAPTRVLDADEAHHLGALMSASGFFEDSKDAAQAAVKVMAGAELGFGAVASMTGVHIIKGKVSLGANLIAAAIQRSGRFAYRVRELNDNLCAIAFYDTGEEVGVSTFTVADATKAGLAGQDNWKRHPRNMLFARALSNGAKWYCAGIFGGPIYTPDELGAEIDVNGEVIQAPPIAEPGPPPTAPATTAPTATVSAPEAEPSTPTKEAPPGPSASAPDTSIQNSSRSSPTPADGPQAPEPTTPAEVLTQLGMDSSTQQFMLVAVGVEDIGDLDAAYASLTDEQAKRIVELARERATP